MNGVAITTTRAWTWLRLTAAAAVLAVLALRVGAAPFLDGVRRVDATAVLVGLVVTAGTTACCAWRWSLLSERLAVAVPFGTAYRRYYRSQLVNATLPAGVLGDVHRGVDHGRRTGAMGRGLRSVLWDRASGQMAQAGLAVAGVLVLPPPVRADVGVLVLGACVAVGGVVLALPVRVRRAVGAELGTLRPVLPRVAVSSVLATLGHVAVFVVVARSLGVAAPLVELAALGLVVLLASALPLSIAGWGPREGAAAWLFAAAGLGAATGVSVAVAFGVVSLVATLPGVVTLVPERTREAVRA